MNEVFSPRVEERLKRLLEELEIPPPVPEKVTVPAPAVSENPFPQELVRTYYSALNLYIHSELPHTSTLPALAIPFIWDEQRTGKISLYKKNQGFLEHEKWLIETILETLIFHLRELIKQPAHSTQPTSTRQHPNTQTGQEILPEKGFVYWNGEIAPIFSPISIPNEKKLATIEADDVFLAKFRLSLHSPSSMDNHEDFMISVLSTLGEHIKKLAYQHKINQQNEERMGRERHLEQLLNARTLTDILAVFCTMFRTTTKGYFCRYEENDHVFKIASGWHSTENFSVLNREIPAEPFLKTVFTPPKIIQFSANSDIPELFKDLKTFLEPEEHVMFIPLTYGNLPEGFILVITSAWNEQDETTDREILQYAQIATLIIQRFLN